MQIDEIDFSRAFISKISLSIIFLSSDTMFVLHRLSYLRH